MLMPKRITIQHHQGAAVQQQQEKKLQFDHIVAPKFQCCSRIASQCQTVTQLLACQKEKNGTTASESLLLSGPSIFTTVRSILSPFSSSCSCSSSSPLCCPHPSWIWRTRPKNREKNEAIDHQLSPTDEKLMWDGGRRKDKTPKLRDREKEIKSRERELRF